MGRFQVTSPPPIREALLASLSVLVLGGAGCEAARPLWVDAAPGVYLSRGEPRIFAVGRAGNQDAAEGGRELHAEKQALLDLVGVVRTRVRSWVDRIGTLEIDTSERERVIESESRVVETAARGTVAAPRREARWFDEDAGVLYLLVSASVAALERSQEELAKAAGVEPPGFGALEEFVADGGE